MKKQITNDGLLFSVLLKSQSELKEFVYNTLVDYYGVKNVFNRDGYVLAKGELPVTLVAHLDTVHQDLCNLNNIKIDGNIISSSVGIGGDDRCGVYLILSIIKKGLKPTIIFTEDEEVGCVGAKRFSLNENNRLLVRKTNFIVELDRRSNNDAVFYRCSNETFKNYIIEKGWVEARGTCSDISYIAPVCDRAAVNLSTAYYNAHSTSEYINYKELQEILERVYKLLSEQKNTRNIYRYEEGIYGI